MPLNSDAGYRANTTGGWMGTSIRPGPWGLFGALYPGAAHLKDPAGFLRSWKPSLFGGPMPTCVFVKRVTDSRRRTR